MRSDIALGWAAVSTFCVAFWVGAALLVARLW